MSNVPEDLRYTKTHEWIRLNEMDAEIGITDFAQKQLTDIVYVDLPAEGKKIKKGDVLLTVESVKSAEDVFSPVSGEVVAVNKEIEARPEMINQEPYKTWMVRVKVQEPPKETLTAEEYGKFIGQ
ncbi:MAG: glycine cleavage system protein GcvH [Cuniculiplasma sp.]